MLQGSWHSKRALVDHSVRLALIAMLMRDCRDPRFIREFKAKYAVDVWGEHVTTKKKKKVWRRKDDKLGYPYEEKR